MLLNLLACSLVFPPTAHFNEPGLNPAPTKGWAVTLGESTGTLAIRQNLNFMYSGSMANSPQGTATVAFTADLASVDIGDVNVSVAAPFVREVPISLQAGQDFITMPTPTVSISHDHPLTPADVAALRPLCSQTVPIHLNGTYTSSAFQDAPEGITGDGGKGKLYTLLDAQTVTVLCEVAPAPQ